MRRLDALGAVRERASELFFNPTYGMDANSPTGIDGSAGAGGLSAGGGAALGLGLLTTLFGAFAQQKSSRVKAKLLEYNAQVAEYQAQDAIERGVVAETRRAEETKKIIGAQRVSLARQGVDINEGSAAYVQEDSAYLGELDRMMIRNNAAREAWGYRVQARDFTNNAAYTRVTGDITAGQTLLTGSSNLLLASRGFGRSPFAADPLLVR